MLGGKTVTDIVGGESAAIVEGEPERRRMRLQQHIGNGDLALEVGTLPGVMGILVVADIIPGPSVERPFAYPRHVIRHQIVAERVALVGRAIEVAGFGMNRETDAVTDAGGKDA